MENNTDKINNIDEDIKILKNPQKMKLTQLIRTFKREGIENFVTVKKEHLENLLSELETYREKIIHLSEETIRDLYAIFRKDMNIYFKNKQYEKE